jgi:integrase
MSKKTLNNLLIEWLEHKKNTVKTSSYNSYESIIRNNMMAQLGHLYANDLNFSIYKEYYEKYIIKKSNAYKISIFNILIGCLINYPNKQLILKRFIKENINCKAVGTPYTLLNRKSLGKMINILLLEHDKYNLGILIAICTGMRIGEVCGLKYENIDYVNHLISVEKTVYRTKNDMYQTTLVLSTPKTAHSQRIIPLHQYLFNILARQQGNFDNYVLTQSSTPMDPRILRRHFKYFLEKHGFIKMRFHDLRHTFANLCLDTGVDYKSISELLGHADVSTTLNLYVHSNTKKKQAYIDKLF